jgi:hypothetical protein
MEAYRLAEVLLVEADDTDFEVVRVHPREKLVQRNHTTPACW